MRLEHGRGKITGLTINTRPENPYFHMFDVEFLFENDRQEFLVFLRRENLSCFGAVHVTYFVDGKDYYEGMSLRSPHPAMVWD